MQKIHNVTCNPKNHDNIIIKVLYLLEVADILAVRQPSALIYEARDSQHQHPAHIDGLGFVLSELHHNT